jgi:glycosyltransferase involved in cell wall biosynthesis
MDEFINVDPYDVAGVKPDAYKFYGIFQFIERKHPMALIKSYWSAFQNDENVALILKTYRNGFSNDEKEAVRATIKRLKKVTNMHKYPPIYLIADRLDRSELLGLHKTCDCLAHLDRGEGFGLVPFEAGAFGNPVLITGWGGALEYAKKDNSYLVNYTLTPVFGMPWSPWYSGDQLWAEPDCGHAIELMREIYNNQDGARYRGEKLKQFIADNFSWESVGNKMIEALKSL